MKNGKRIKSIKLGQVIDDTPDFSTLGEYSDSADSDYSIDRKHDLDCASQPFNQPTDAIEKLERAIAYLQTQRREIGNNSDNPLYWTIDEAIDLLSETQESLTECDCDGSNIGWRELRFFNPPVSNYKGLDAEETRKYCLQDYERAESYNAGHWCYIGIRATAEVFINGVFQKITSAGLWGTESDSDESYLREIEQDELSELRTILYEMGFSKRAIATAVKDAERVTA